MVKPLQQPEKQFKEDLLNQNQDEHANTPGRSKVLCRFWKQGLRVKGIEGPREQWIVGLREQGIVGRRVEGSKGVGSKRVRARGALTGAVAALLIDIAMGSMLV